MKSWRPCPHTPRPAASLAAIALAMVAGCAYQPRRALTITSTPGVLEGQHTQAAVTVQNILPHAIIPVSMTLYARRDPTEQFTARRVVGEREFLQPLQAAKVRYLRTLDRVEADQLRDAGTWRRLPDTRFLHPRILLPGQTLTETFGFQALESYRRILYCDFLYFRLDSNAVRDRLFRLDTTKPHPPKAHRYTDVYRRIDETQLTDPAPDPHHYVLYRRREPTPQATHTITKRVPLRVRPRAFGYREAASRARYAPRGHCFFTPANAWALDYHDGTWLVSRAATVKLRGRYLPLLADLDRKAVPTLTLAAPRTPDDKLLKLLQDSGYSDPNDKGKIARATIPVEALPALLQHAESIGYLIDAKTWRPFPKAP